jgi:hypothetical protein
LELYGKQSTNVAPPTPEFYLRVFYNGRDVTGKVRFCRGRTVEGMCPLKYFQQFSQKENFEAVGVKDNEGLKSLCLAKNFLERR